MGRHQNIFFKLVKNETSLTEVFCNLMMYKSFRNAFLEFVKDENKSFNINSENIKFQNFETERNFGFTEVEDDTKLGRGDLILTVDSREYIFEIKIETYTQLTSNQPHNYLKYLEDRKINVNENQTTDDLFFLLPKNYQHINNLSDIKKENILFWEDFIFFLKKNGLDDVFYINDFIDILNYRWFYSEKFEFSEYMKNIITNKRKIKMEEKVIPQIMMDLFHKIDIITERVTKNKLNFTNYKDENGYGIFIKNQKKEDILWFGIDFKFWNEFETPLSIGIDGSDDKYLKLFKNKYNTDIKEIKFDTDEYYYYLPLQIDIYNDTDKIIKKINEVKTVIGLD